MPEQELGFTFDTESCVQCHACEMACKAWRDVEAGAHWRWVDHRWRGAYPAIGIAAIVISCQHCTEPACIAACPSGAISKLPDDGVVLVDPDLCTGCQICFSACPFAVPQFGADGIMQKCDLCRGAVSQNPQPDDAPPCVRTCPTEALRFGWMTIAEKSRQEQLLTDLLNAE